MGYQDRAESRGEGNEDGVRLVHKRARGSVTERREENHGREHQERHSFGIKGGGARGSQAAADALRKRQKANKAALTKRHAAFKARTRLIRDFEERKAASSDVFVAPELRNVVASKDQAASGTEVARHFECRGADKLPVKHSNNVAASCKHPEWDENGRESNKEKHDVDEIRFDSGGEDDGAENNFDVDGTSLSRSGLSQFAFIESESKKARAKSARGKIVKSRKFSPFQKELDIAAARQREIVGQPCSFAVIAWSDILYQFLTRVFVFMPVSSAWRTTTIFPLLL